MRLNLSADDVLTTTRSVRKRLDLERPVEREIVEECLEIALQAPTGSNSQGWQFVFVTDPAKKQALADIYARNFQKYAGVAASNKYQPGDLRHEQKERVTESAMHLVEHFHEVPVLLVPCIEGELDRAPTFVAASAWGSLLPAVWSLMLALRERGMGSAWTTIHLMDGGDAEAAEILGIPAGYTQAGLFPIAYTQGTEFQPAKRLPLDTVTHWDTW